MVRWKRVASVLLWSQSCLLSGMAAPAADLRVEVTYELMLPDGTFGDRMDMQREELCHPKSNTRHTLYFGQVRNTAPVDIDMTTQLAYESAGKIIFMKRMVMKISEAKMIAPLSLSIARTSVSNSMFCLKPLPEHIYMIISAAPSTRSKKYKASPRTWTPLDGRRTVSGPLTLSVYRGTDVTSVSPAWLAPAGVQQAQAISIAVSDKIPPRPTFRTCIDTPDLCLARLMGWEPQQPAPGGALTTDILLSRADTPVPVTVSVQSAGRGWTYLRLQDHSQKLTPGVYSGLSPFVADDKAVPMTLNVRQGPWYALVWLVFAATLGWVLNWIRKRVLASLELVATLREYRKHIAEMDDPTNLGYRFQQPMLEEIDALLTSASSVAGPLGGNTDDLKTVQDRLDGLQQREADWNGALRQFQRLNIAIAEAGAALQLEPARYPNLLISLNDVMAGKFNGTPPQTFTSELWKGNPTGTGLEAVLRAAIDLARTIEKYPLPKYDSCESKMSTQINLIKTELAKAIYTLDELLASESNYTAAGANAEAILQGEAVNPSRSPVRFNSFSMQQGSQSSSPSAIVRNKQNTKTGTESRFDSTRFIMVVLLLLVLVWSTIAGHVPWGFAIALVLLLLPALVLWCLPPQWWSNGILRGVRATLSVFVAVVVIGFSVISGFRTEYLNNATWGASWVDYFSALAWGLGLSGGIALIIDVLDNLRRTVRAPAA